ncbi:ABC transporter [Pantoea sp. 1.19]|uniref:ABC transporter n=1 Tax=Pantoea sp. 1.19 TaxID=1925589 RepID=UPI000948ED1F
MRLAILWGVFCCRNAAAALGTTRRHLQRAVGQRLARGLRFCPLPLLLAIARAGCALRLFGRGWRAQRAVATENIRSLTGQPPALPADWIALRRRLLEQAATWGQHPALRQQIQRCAAELDRVVAPLHRARQPVILAPLHTVSDVLAAMVGASVTPGKASVVVSASAEHYPADVRALGGVQLAYCSIHQQSDSLALRLAALVGDVTAGEQNLIIFPDITPDYTLQAEGALAARLPCRLFGRAAHLHQGAVRLAGMMSARVVVYHLWYEGGLHIRIHDPLAADQVADTLPTLIEQTLRARPHEWLLWHSHSLFFIHH